MLELRVLSGLHSQARCHVQDGDSIGADAACDIVLADPGMEALAARVAVQSQGWQLLASADAADAAAFVPFNQPLQLGPVWVTVSHPDALWPDPPVKPSGPDADQALSGPEAEAETGAELLAGSESGADPGAAAKPDEAGDSGSLPGSDSGPAETSLVPQAIAAQPGSSRRRVAPVLLALAVCLLATGIALFMLVMPDGDVPDTEPPDQHEAALQSMGRITAVIDSMGLGSRLHVALQPDGQVTVQGWVRDSAEHDALSTALAQIWPMPGMRVSNEHEAMSLAQSVLGGHDMYFEPQYEGGGRLRVSGIAGAELDLAVLLENLRERLPGMTILQGRVLQAGEVMHELSQRLAGQGLSQVRVFWQDRRLAAEVHNMSADQITLLQGILNDFNKTRFGIARLAYPGNQAYADRVPFGVRSVVSGPQPYIVLADGTRLLEGGTYQGYLLREIRADSLHFDGPQPAILTR